MEPSSYVADFDSTLGMVRALSNYLHGSDFPMLGAVPRWRAPAMKVLAATLNALPAALQEQVYIWSGRSEAITPRKLAGANAEHISGWITGLYPKRKYPAMAIGSANGALTHLWAALGIPWLPQTFLIPVARRLHPDEPMQDLEWAKRWAPPLLAPNPDVQLHQLFDPNQDRLMIRRMAYFRVKRLVLGRAYERFIRQTLVPGGTLVLVECQLKWPTTRVGDRHVFQFGALGGAAPQEYHQGGVRVAEYLARYGSHRRCWEPPAPDAERPEAEWGFEPRLGEDAERFARDNGFRLRRVRFEQPEAASPFVADFYQRWNQARGIETRRLLVESFIVMEPYWTVRTGSVPFWMVFNMQPSADALNTYLDVREPFDEIGMMLFSHGVESIGLVPTERWRAVLARARNRGVYVGVDERAYPRDFAVFVRYCYDLQRQFSERHPLPAPLAQDELDRFLLENEGRYAVQWS